MKSTLRRALMTLSAVFALLAVASPGVSAQQTNNVANGFRISPVRSELTIEKGKSETITVTVENPTDIATVAKPTVNDFVASDKEDGEPLLVLDDTGDAPKNSFKKLVGTVNEATLGPREKKDVTVTVTVPEDANAGGYYGAIRFAPGIVGQQSNVGLTASVGTIVLVRVPGNLTEKLDLLQLSAGAGDKAKSFFTGGDVSVIARLKNDGDIHVKPFGKIQVKDMFGKVTAEYEINNTEPRANILPGSTRKFVDTLPKKKLFGRYTISANIGYSQGSGDIISAKMTFWYVPMWAIIVLIVLVLLVVFGGFMLFRRIRRMRQKHGQRH